MSQLLIVLCIILWGISTFLNRLSVERLSPLLMQVIVGSVFLFYIPIALKLSGINNPLNYKWSIYSVSLTVIATLLSIIANLLLYTGLKGSSHTGTSTMMVSLYPIITFILSVFLLNEHITIIKIIGIIAMIIGAVMLGH